MLIKLRDTLPQRSSDQDNVLDLTNKESIDKFANNLKDTEQFNNFLWMVRREQERMKPTSSPEGKEGEVQDSG